ncbi:MAG: hypothetical protein QM831_24150 [Kofleriaceae bacterium]
MRALVVMLAACGSPTQQPAPPAKRDAAAIPAPPIDAAVEADAYVDPWVVTIRPPEKIDTSIRVRLRKDHETFPPQPTATRDFVDRRSTCNTTRGELRREYVMPLGRFFNADHVELVGEGEKMKPFGTYGGHTVFAQPRSEIGFVAVEYGDSNDNSAGDYYCVHAHKLADGTTELVLENIGGFISED